MSIDVSPVKYSDSDSDLNALPALTFYKYKIYINIAPNQVLFKQKKKRSCHFFLFFHGNICCGYSLDLPHSGTSNEYPHHML